jgi:hypothetical protein
LAHHEHSNKLNHIDAPDLLVYKNKASFDKRNNAAEDEGKEEALDPTQSVDGLGSKEDMLVVVVPSPSQPPQQATQTPSFPFCKLPFFNNIRNVSESDGWVSFGEENIPSTFLNRLYIRECYRTIASSILEVNGIHKAIITGTPGIAKSLFLIYLLWKLVKEGKRVLFIYGSYNIYYDGKGGVFHFENGRLPSDIDYSF